MPRLLIVSPHFPPVNAPDMQRVRMSLPHFVAAGWDVTVLTVDDPEPAAPLEPELNATVPAAVRVVRAKTVSRHRSRWLGIGNLGWRTFTGTASAGLALLRAERFDLVYFSTTQFAVCPLGRWWREKTGVPYVIDLQDPWVNEFYARTGTRPPGGWKFHAGQPLTRGLERWTMRTCSHVISVSPVYLAELRSRYPWFTADQGSVLPFGAPIDDLNLARTRQHTLPPILPARKGLRIGYAGRLGSDMTPALDFLFAAAAARKRRGRETTIHFYGTSYAADGSAKPFTTPMAERHGISTQVHEQTGRIGYLDSLRVLLESDVAIVLGSTDAAYSPSKLNVVLASGRPALAIAAKGSVLHEAALAAGMAIAELPPDASAKAHRADELAELLDRIEGGNFPPPVGTVRTAAEIAEAQLEIFQRVIANTPPQPSV